MRMRLRILFSVIFFPCLYDFCFSSANLFKSTVLHEVQEHILTEQIRATQHIATSPSSSNLLASKLSSCNYCRTLSKLVDTNYSWGDVSIIWQKRFRRFGYWVCYRDCGGGGDCLFSSIISSLKLNNTDVSMLRRLVADRMIGFNTTSIYNNGRSTAGLNITSVIESSGEISTDSNSTNSAQTDNNSYRNSTHLISNWNETAYLEKMDIFAALEAAGEWKDPWSPSSILNSNFLYGTDISSNFKKALLVHKLLSKPGNTHWGSDWDVNFIEIIYKVKVVILWKNRGIFYPSVGNETSFTKIVLIYYDDAGHFQVIGLKKMNSSPNSDLISLFNKNRIPTSLKRLYKDDTNNDLD